MAETLFDGAVTGNVYDADSLDWVGTISNRLCFLFNWDLASGSTYRFINCDAIYFPTTMDFICPPNSVVQIEGGAADGTQTVLTCLASTWTGFRLDSGVRIEVTNCEWLNVDPDRISGFVGAFSVGTQSTRTGLHDDILVLCTDCTFDENNAERVLDFYCRDNCVAYFVNCIFKKGSIATDTVFDSMVSFGHATSVVTPIIYCYNCTWFWETDSAGVVQETLRVNNGTIYVKDSIITEQNTGAAGTSKIGLNVGGGTIQSLGNNFLHTYVEAHLVGDYTSDPTDQTVDPTFDDDTLPTLDLHPDGSVGSPQLYLASSIEEWVGALEPSNLGTLRTVAGAGASAVYAEAKQRIYEKSFGLNPTRGRGLRMRMRSRDGRSVKTYAGLWVRHTREEPK